MFSAKLLSHDPKKQNLSFTYSVALSSKETLNGVVEKNRMVSLSGSHYYKFVNTKNQNFDIPNKVLIEQHPFEGFNSCGDEVKACLSEVAFYSDYNLFLVSLSLNLKTEELKNTLPEPALEAYLSSMLRSINPWAAEFYSSPYELNIDDIDNKFRLESAVVAVDANIGDKQYVGYAMVKMDENLSVSNSVEESNNSIIQYITRLCESVRSGDFPKKVVVENCNFSGTK
ncbi:hypothetical protein [Vibrio cyclitrophicus]|uniref:hypothetical protein n=1 Tax=Vibrio cyclitrophicus TaxID=47951 RepID=UPI000C85E61D|nr:hypothetical protein [Vibrio cyclitrophicus]PMF37710.1 hypothetical protein BCV14_10265 [Vibrio cyclitrophicus]